MVFNVKEIKPEHQPLLKRVERLIKHELPYRFGILSDDEYNNGQGNEKDPFDDEYKLFYSRYRYGKFFHITTEYVHTMSNISDKAHGYKNSITLEELIYSCGLNSESGKPFLEDLKIEYEIREHQINNYGMVQSQINEKRHKNERNENSVKNRSDFVFDLYEKDKAEKIVKEHKFEVVLRNKEVYKTLNNKDIKFILMFKSSVQQYTLIYSLNSLFYKLVIESNIKSIIDEIITELNTMILSNNSTTIKFKNPTKLFKIVSNTILDIEDYKLIFSYNPTLLIKIKNTKTEDIINISNYYNTELLYLKESIKLINLYNKKAIKYDRYKNEAQTFTNENKKCNIIEQFKSDKLNCVYKNINDCGYDFWEFFNIEKNHLIINVVPNSESMDTPYLGNFMDLDGNKTQILKMLNEIVTLYLNNNNMCFLHTTITIQNNILHFHVVKKTDNYNREFSNQENQVFILQALHINTIITNIKNNKLYYKNIDYNKLKTY